MIYGLKKLIIAIPALNPVRLFIEKLELFSWKKSGKPLPPPHIVKEVVLREYAQKFKLSILVETGTYLGDTIAAMLDDFETLYSIELSKDLYEKAVERFKGVEKVNLIQGDSGEELQKVVSSISKPALFWLDGHFSAAKTAKGELETPVNKELESILNLPEKRHVIIIDDARFFGTDPAYPKMEELTEKVKSIRPEMQISVKDDIIRITSC